MSKETDIVKLTMVNGDQFYWNLEEKFPTQQDAAQYASTLMERASCISVSIEAGAPKSPYLLTRHVLYFEFLDTPKGYN